MHSETDVRREVTVRKNAQPVLLKKRTKNVKKKFSIPYVIIF